MGNIFDDIETDLKLGDLVSQLVITVERVAAFNPVDRFGFNSSEIKIILDDRPGRIHEHIRRVIEDHWGWDIKGLVYRRSWAVIGYPYMYWASCKYGDSVVYIKMQIGARDLDWYDVIDDLITDKKHYD